MTIRKFSPQTIIFETTINNNMKNQRWFRVIIGILLISTNIGCDQLTKSIVREAVLHNEQITVIANHVTVTKVENTGAFLSMGQSWWKPLKLMLFIVLPIMALGIAFYVMVMKSNLSIWFTTGLAFLIGGGIGNLVDRILYGSVTDFLHLKAGMFQTGIFNMADVSIMAGIGIVLIDAIVRKNWNGIRASTLFKRIDSDTD